jgi:predicted nucleotidyltransferase
MTTRLPEETAYLETARRRARAAEARWAERRQQAWEAVRRAAVFIKASYPNARVRVFGSVLYPDSFGPQSNIDLAVEGVGWPEYLRLWSALDRLEPAFEIDLIDVEIVSSRLAVLLEREDGPSERRRPMGNRSVA